MKTNCHSVLSWNIPPATKTLRARKIMLFLLLTSMLSLSSSKIYSNTESLNYDLAQNITGTVVDESGLALIGVSISIKGTSSGTITDLDGRYQLQVADDVTTLIFSYTGYSTTEIEINSRTLIDVTMVEASSVLDEVVVVGYGTARRRDISGAVSTLRLEDSPLALSPSTNPLQALRGGVAGVNIGAQNSPGTTPSIVVRGQNSINGSNNPLIVLDGIIYLGSISDINPEDIAVMDVLKDASAAAVYGSRAANGVIVITTKRGKSDKPTIRYNTSVGFNSWPSPPEMMDLERWTEKFVAQTPSINSPSEIVFDDVTRTQLFAQGVDTDFMDLISRDGFHQNHQLAVSGRSDRLNYYFSGGFGTNEGPIIGDDFQRISIRSRLTTDITDWLEVGVDGSYNNNDFSGVGASITSAYLMAPHGFPYRWESMPAGAANATGTLLERYPTGSSIQSPLWGTDGTIEDIDKRNFFRLATHALIKVPKIEGLTYRINYSVNANNNTQNRFVFEDFFIQEQLVEPFFNRYSPGELAKGLAQANGFNNITNSNSYVVDNILNYKREMRDHYIDLTAVATRDRSYSKLVSAIGSDFSANGNTLLGVDGIHRASVQRTNLDVIESANIGYLGRASYAYKDKYHLSATLRRDGASVFGVDRKWGNFPSIGLAWTASEEPFFDKFEKLDYLKIKASYGQNGNQGLAAYQTLARVANASSGGIRYEFADAPSTILYGIAQTDLGNPNLGWETTTAFNGGFQSAWFKNKLFLDLDFYFSKTKDQIFSRQIPIMTGFSSIFSSLGQVDNKGIEINLRTINVTNDDFSWSSGLTFWQNRNIVKELFGDDLDGDGFEDDDIANSLFIGESLGAIYGYEFIGVVQEDDTEYIANVGAVPGDPMFSDISGPDGVPDGIITADFDRKILGFNKENFRLSLSNTVEYKNFSLYVMIAGIFGGGKDNFYLAPNPRYNSFIDRFDTNEIDHDWWTPENQSEIFLRPDFNGNRYLGLQSRSFVRIQDVVFSYKLGESVLDRAGLGSLEVFGSVNNLMVFTGWFGGGDPELGIRPDSGTYPVPRTTSIGLKVSF